MTHLIGVSPAWMRAACAVHQEERRLRRFIAEMYRASNALGKAPFTAFTRPSSASSPSTRY